jgi:large subunit ribosomal protein L30
MALEKKVKKDGPKKIKVTLVRSTIACSEKQKRTVEALGLKKIRSTAVHTDTPNIQGMIFVVKHLVAVEEA